MKILKYFVVVMVFLFGGFSSNAQLSEHIYSLDVESVDDTMFSASDFNIVAERRPSTFQGSVSGRQQCQSWLLVRVFLWNEVFQERNHGRILSPVSRVFA